ncbi:MAG: LOG family protein, partial [Candidatus Omnitrophica bacterium]|nr:LOG family protein [Candidatus Omnitrophota bacterium]
MVERKIGEGCTDERDIVSTSLRHSTALIESYSRYIACSLIINTDVLDFRPLEKIISTDRISSPASGVDRPTSGASSPLATESMEIITIKKDLQQINRLIAIVGARKIVSFMGTARIDERHTNYVAARTMAKLLSLDSPERYAVITGGGPGIMQAANEGAREGGVQSIGLTVDLPQQKEFNQVNSAVEIKAHFDSYFARKAAFVQLSDAFVFMQGGFGVLDEFFELLALKVYGLIDKDIPLILFGSEHYLPLVNLLRETYKEGAIRKDVFKMFTLTDDPDHVLKMIREARIREKKKINTEVVISDFRAQKEILKGLENTVYILGADQKSSLAKELSQQLSSLGISILPSVTHFTPYLFVKKVAILDSVTLGFAFAGQDIDTLNLFFEALVLIQTGKIDKVPLILLGSHWEKWQRWFFEQMYQYGYIFGEEVVLFSGVSENAQSAVEVIRNFKEASSNSEESTCPFCKLTNRSGLFLGETTNFRIVLDPHPLAQGHTLIFPKTHDLSMSTLSEGKLSELGLLQYCLRGALEEVSRSDVIFFEHGSVNKDAERVRAGGNSLVHAHLHGIPVPKGFDVLEKIKNNPNYVIRQIDGFSDLRAQYRNDKTYLFYENAKEQKFIIEINQAPSQFLRILIANELGNKDVGNWKTAPEETRQVYKKWIKELKAKLFARIFLYLPDYRGISALLNLARTTEDGDLKKVALNVLSDRVRPLDADTVLDRIDEYKFRRMYYGFTPRAETGTVIHIYIYGASGLTIFHAQYAMDGRTIERIYIEHPDKDELFTDKVFNLFDRAALKDTADLAYPALGFYFIDTSSDFKKVTLVVNDAIIGNLKDILGVDLAGSVADLHWEIIPLSEGLIFREGQLRNILRVSAKQFIPQEKGGTSYAATCVSSPLGGFRMSLNSLVLAAGILLCSFLPRP